MRPDTKAKQLVGHIKMVTWKLEEANSEQVKDLVELLAGKSGPELPHKVAVMAKWILGANALRCTVAVWHVNSCCADYIALQ